MKNKKIVILITLIFVLGLSAILLAQRVGQETPYLPGDADTHLDEVIEDDGHELTPALDLTSNQIIAYGYLLPSLDINVSVFTLTNSFAVVYRKGSQGDELIGSSELAKVEEKTEVVIPTGDTLDFGDEILVKLFEDDGDGIFDPEADSVILDQDNSPIEESFFISSID